MKDIRLTKEQMEALAPYEEHLRTAYKSGWARNITTGKFRSMKALYDNITGKNNNVNGNCGFCVLDMLRNLGQVYFYTKEIEAREEAEKKGQKRGAFGRFLTRKPKAGTDTAKTEKAEKTPKTAKAKPAPRVTVVKTKRIPS